MECSTCDSAAMVDATGQSFTELNRAPAVATHDIWGLSSTPVSSVEGAKLSVGGSGMLGSSAAAALSGPRYLGPDDEFWRPLRTLLPRLDKLFARVFDGIAPSPYDTESETNPMQVNGETKFTGERAILENNESALVA